MKTLTLISTFLISLSAFANPKAGDFNRAIMEDVKDDLRQHEDVYKAPSRGPASVDEVSERKRLEDQMKQEKKIEKMNFRQNQPSKW
jgi:hypothetical protein